ncbi:hypothetical protein [Azospirillum doebereinerae]
MKTTRRRPFFHRARLGRWVLWIRLVGGIVFLVRGLRD